MSTDQPNSKKILLALWDGGGVVPPLLAVGRRLVERGHTVVVLGDPTVEPEADAHGCGFISWTRAPHRRSRDRSDDPVRDYLGRPRQHMREFRDYFFTSGADWTADAMQAIDDHGIDLVMADFMLIWAGLAAETRGIPFVCLSTFPYAIPTTGFPPLGASLVPVPKPLQALRDRIFGAMSEKVYDGSKKVLNELREKHGLSSVRHSLDQVRAAQAIVVLSPRAFDFPDHPTPDNVTWSGPILDDPTWAATPFEPPWATTDDRPLVVVAMSSTFQNQAETLRQIVEALSMLPVRAVVSLGPALNADEVPGTDNVIVASALPHAELIPQASLLITHCGHGTAIKGLAAGVPILCIPMGRDQGDNAARIVSTGAGLKLKRTANAAKIKAAAERIMADSTYRDAAQQSASTIAAGIGDTDPVRTIEQALTAGGMSRRPQATTPATYRDTAHPG